MHASPAVRRPLVTSSTLLALALGVLTACGGGSSTSTLTVVSTTPSSIAAEVPIESEISASFSSPIDGSTVTTSTFYVSPPLGGTIQVAGVVATFKHTTSLQPNTTYTVKLASSIADINGDTLGSDHVWSFTTSAQ